MNLLQEAEKLFGNLPRPEHFTNYTHCCEILQPGWDPLCFITPEGFQYFFPALARLALDGSGDSYFVDRLIFHLELDGKQNARFLQFTPEQRQYVVRLLHYLVETRAAEIERNLDSDALFRAIEIWEEEHDA